MASADAEYATPLFRAVGEGDPKQVERLLGAGADVNARDEFGATPLDLAVCGCWHPDEANPIVQLLIDAGADLNATTTPNDREGSGGCTPLMEASGEGHVTQVELLLAAGADPLVVSTGGWTALTFATQAGAAALERVTLLLAAGADPSVRDREGRTALDLARATQAILESPDYAVTADEVLKEIEKDARKEIASMKLPPGVLEKVEALQVSGPSVTDQIAEAGEVVRLLERAANPR